jgi:hypothetical protein
MPAERVTAEPTGEPLTLNCTVPVGVDEPVVGETVAVKVTDTPKVEGFCEEASSVVVPMGLTCWLTVLDVLPV